MSGGVRLVFAGTPEFACPTLAALVQEGHEVAGVLTQPDRPAGRGRRLTASAVKTQAQALGIPVFTPPTGAEACACARALAPDVVVVVAYGLLLPRELLGLPPYGCLNVHASLLPRWRGAAPIARAIEAGDSHTGISIIRLDEGLDTGPVLMRATTPIDPLESAPELAARLAQMGARAMGDVLAAIAREEPPPAVPQPATGALYARKLTKAEGVIDWQEPASVIARRVRAFTPWPGTRARLEGLGVKICAASSEDSGPSDPGRVLSAEGDVRIATARGTLIATILQADNERPLPAARFLQKHPLTPGDRFQ